MHLNFFQLAFEFGDVVADDTRIDFQLLFAFAFCTHAARLAALTVQMCPTPFQTREGVVGLCELDLQCRLIGLCMGGEDVENNLLSVDDGERGHLFPIALLRWREKVIEDDDFRFCVFGELCDFLCLSFADEQPWIGLADFDDLRADDFQTERVRQFGEFVDEFRGDFRLFWL